MLVNGGREHHTPLSRGAPSERIVLLAVALGTTLAPLNSTMIAVALPRILEEMEQGPAASAWLITAYLVAMAALQPFAGALGDRFGRRRLMLLGLGWFGIVSLGATFAASFPLLAACRIQQGIAAAIALPNGTAVARDVLPPERRARGFSLIGTLTGIAAAGGPPLGGLLVATAGWRAMFLASVPIVLTSLALAWRAIPAGVTETHSSERTPQRRGWLPHLVQPRSFAAACATVCLSNLAFYTTLLVVPLLFASAPGWTSARSGGVLAALLGASLLCTPLGGALADRLGRRYPAVGGQLLVTAALFGLALAARSATAGTAPPLPALIATLTLAGAGLGLSGPGMQTAAVEAAGPADSGAAAGLYSTSRYVGSIAGSAALAALLGSDSSTAAQLDAVFSLIVLAAALSALTALGLRARE